MKKLHIRHSWDMGCGFAFIFSFDGLSYGHWVDEYKWVTVFSFRFLWWYDIVSVSWFPKGVEAWKKKSIINNI